jgi:non-specific serine/threonine protein kinase
MPETRTSNLVGRRDDLQRLTDLLGPGGGRCVTVTGAPGVGKTALARAAAAHLRSSFEHGIVTVDLAPVADSDDVAAAVAQALGVRETTDRTLLPQLRTFLRDRRMLLVLDNFEHVLGAAGLVGDILAATSGVRVLVTSRGVLRLAEEWEFPLEPLPVPRSADLAAVVRSPAVELFVERAQVQDPRFSVTPQNAGAVAEICARLDGVPLAIELAAARAGTLPPDVLAEQLRRPLAVLVATDPAAAERHRTMREAIGWSESLLGPLEREVFRRLAVFAGGCSIEAAQSVCTGVASPPEIHGAIRSLTGHSLLQVIDPGARLSMFDTMREYGLERLGAAGALDDVRRQQALWVLNLTERAEARLQGPEQKVWLQRLDEESENLRAALRWTFEAGDVDLALRLVGAVWWYWYVRGRFSEGRRWLERATALNGGRPSARAKVLSGAAGLATLQGDMAAGGTFADQARDLADALADPDSKGHALMNLSMVALRGRDLDRAARQLEESARLFQQAGNKWGRACALVNLQGLVRNQGDADRARTMLEESVSLLREVGDKMCGASAINGLAKQARATGDNRRATVLYRESLLYAKELGSTLGVAQSLEGLAAASADGAPRFAAILLGASEAARITAGVSIPPHVQADRDKTAGTARAGLGDEPFDDAWTAGRGMAVDEAVAFALAGRHTEDRRTGALTEREEQVAALVAEGLTNRQIAAALFVTERTAENHVQHIMNKLGVTSRAQVAVWAATRGLQSKK